MAIEGMEDLSDDEIEARQRAEDGETADHDPKTGETEDDEEAKAAADAKALADAEAAKTATTTAEEDLAKAGATEAAADKTAGAEDAKDPKVEGVLSKDGARVLPYGALQAARRDARRAEGRAERTERELEEARQQIADLKAGKNPDGDKLTEEKVADMEANFPEEGKHMRAAFNRIQELEAKVPKTSKPADDEPSDDPVQDAIDQVPLLLDWQHEDPVKFARAVEHDAVLVKSPKWAGKPAVERFAEATRRTADEYDIAFPDPKAKASTTNAAPAAKPNPAETATRKPPETLSDFKGGAIPDHGTADVQKMAPTALLTRMNGMSDDEIDAHLAKYG